MKKIKDKVKNVSKVKNANMSKVLQELSEEKKSTLSKNDNKPTKKLS